MGGGKKAVIKMETRIRELESELDAESSRYADTSKNLRKTERKIKELTLESELDAESRRYADTSKNLRKTERKIKELTFVSDEDEQALARMKARARSASVGL